MGTGTSRARLAIAALILGLAGCGTSGTSAFSWLRSQPPPSTWRVVAIPSGAAMAYPPSWRPLHGDAGTATAALEGGAGRFLGYLNLTPRQATESLSNWISFRIDHNAEEGDRAIRRIAAATRLHFLGGRGACVKDSYTTRVGTRFVEIACLVVGAHSQAVIVAAAPPAAWSQESGTLEREIESVRT